MIICELRGTFLSKSTEADAGQKPRLPALEPRPKLGISIAGRTQILSKSRLGI